jgi:hypothetical protein
LLINPLKYDGLTTPGRTVALIEAELLLWVAMPKVLNCIDPGLPVDVQDKYMNLFGVCAGKRTNNSQADARCPTLVLMIGILVNAVEVNCRLPLTSYYDYFHL